MFTFVKNISTCNMVFPNYAALHPHFPYSFTFLCFFRKVIKAFKKGWLLVFFVLFFKWK